jgi:hypothetical protein
MSTALPTTTLPTQAFFNKLMQLLPPRNDCNYHDHTPWPTTETNKVSEAPLIFHPAQFSWDGDSTVKGPPEAKVCLLLTESFLTDGFVTAGDNLLISTRIGDTDNGGLPL